MKTYIRSQALFSGAIIIGTILFASATASAGVITQTINESASGDWTQAIWGTPPAVAVAGNSYLVPPTFFLRTLNTANAQTFAGDSVIITNGGGLYLKHAGGVATVNLVLSGGQIIEHGGGTGATFTPLGGTLQVLTDTSAQYSIGSDQSAGNHDIWLQSTLSGSGNLIVNMLANLPNTLALYGTNSAYSGNWTNDNGTIEIRSGSVNALGSGSVSLTKTTSLLSFNTTNNLVLSNSIGGVGSLIKGNTNTVSLNGNLSFAGFTTISNGVLQIGANSSIANSSVISLLGGVATLDVSAAGGLLMNTANGQIMNCNGALIGGLTASTGNTLNFNLTPATNDLLNITGSLTLNGNPSLNLTASGFKPPGTYRLINYTGTIQGGGSFALVPPVGSSETFGLDTSTPGQVNLVVSGVVHNLTWVGDGSQNNWDTTTANWAGGTNVFSTGDNVTFNDAGSAIPNINFVTSVSPGSITVSNTIQPYIFGVVAGGTPPGIVTSGGLTKLGTNELDFVTSGNNISGPISIQSGILSIGTGGSTGSLGTGSITNNGILQVNLGSGAVAFNSLISGSGSLQITGGGATVSIGGNGHNTYTGLTTIGDGCQLNIATSNALGSSSSGTIVLANGRLGVASLVGSMTVSEPVVINGTGISTSPGALYVNTSGNNVTWAGPITVASASQIRAVNPNARMNFSSTVLGTNVALECTSGNTVGDATSMITFLNTLSLGSGGSLTADGLAVVVLAGGTNAWGGGTTVLNGTLLVNGKLDGGAVTVNNSGTLGGSGMILGSVAVSGGSLAPGSSGIGTLTISDSVTLDDTSTNVMELNRTNAQNADLLAASSLTFSGTLTVVNIGPALAGGDTFHLFSGAVSSAFTVTNLPVLSGNLFWDTSLLSSGILKVGSNTPIITFPTISGANFTLQVAASQAGSNYVLQAAPALNPPVTWTSIQTNSGTGGPLNFTNPITGFPQRFFRIQVQ